MKQLIHIILLISSPFYLFSPVWADEYGFATSRDEIIHGLSRQQLSTTRSFSTRQLTRKNDQPQSVNLKIRFNSNDSTLNPRALPMLDALGEALSSPQLETASFSILGHTDSDGALSYNESLSLKRAQSVKNYLMKTFLIPSERLKTFGYGESRPLLPNTTASNKQTNRRVEIRIQ